MKNKYLLHGLIASALIASGLAGCESAHHLQAKVSKDEAEKTALAKVPNGTIKESELEKEKGRVIWSFDIATPDSPDITEVAVDAMTGEVISVEKETPKQQAKEEAEDASKKEKK